MAAIVGDVLLPPTRSDNESSDIECEDDDDDYSRRLIRLRGQHRKVSAVVEPKIWEIKGIFEVPEDTEMLEVHHLIKEEEEKERKRRMSAPYNATVDITDVEWFHRSRKLSNVHEQLIRLFAMHQAIYETTCEQQRRIVEAKKRVLHEELLRYFTKIAVSRAVENERSRKMKVLTEMAEGRGENLSEIADVNSKLGFVHDELKDAFKKVWDEQKRRDWEKEIVHRDNHVMMLKDDENKQTCTPGIAGREHQICNSRLSEVHKELKTHFNVLKDKHENVSLLSDIGILTDDTDTEEDRIRFVNIENAKRLMAIEQSRRINETLSDDEFNDKMQIVEKLFSLHKQLKQKLGTL